MFRTRLVLAAFVPLLLAACQPATAPKPAPPTEAPPAKGGKLTIAVIPKAVSQQFWTTVRMGADAMGQEGNAQIIWKGPSSETDIAGQKSIVEDFITQKVSAIVLAACDADALVETIKKAEAAGVPVITIDSGVKWDEVRSLVATDNVAGAKKAGETLVELIGGHGPVALIPFVKGAASSEQREEGFKAALKEAKGIELVATRYSESDVGKGKSVTQDILTSQPDLAGIFAANEGGAVGAANALKEMGKAGKVKLVGFDGSPDEIELLKQGVIQALVIQDPYKMGHEGVRQALQAAAGKPVEKRVDTGVVVVTKANLESPEVQKLLNPGGTK